MNTPEYYTNKWIGNITRQFEFEEAKSIITQIWEHEEVYGKTPKVILCDSPFACKKAAERDRLSGDIPISNYNPSKVTQYHEELTGGGASDKTIKNTDAFQNYFSLWAIDYSATFELSKANGTAFNEQYFDEFIRWSKCCHFVHFNDEVVYVSQNPKTIHLDNRYRLSNENGPAMEYNDGWAIYAIGNVTLDEQIIMRPWSQTIEQIQNEQSEEVRLIRIERYGYDRYLEQIGAELIDENRNDIEGTLEFLFAGKDITVLLTRCPSTGKRFSLRVPTTIKSCGDAQMWLSSGASSRIISAS